MRRVIYAWDYIEWGGAQIHFLALAKEAQKEFEVAIVLPDGTDRQFLGFLEREGLRYETFSGHIDGNPRHGILQKLRRHWFRIKAERAMLEKIAEVGIDAAVHTDLLPAQSLFSLAWLCMRTQVFITLHNALPPVPGWRWLLWRLKFGVISRFESFHVFCTNKHAASYFSRLFSKQVADDIKITYDSIDPVEIELARSSPFDRRSMTERFGISADKFVVLSIGQFVDRKGRWIFLEAAKRLSTVSDEFAFVWVSPALPFGVEFERVENYELGDSLRLIRSADIGTARQDILEFFRIADVFALPSYVEGVPIALLEAMALGVPCVSTNVYGIPEAIIDERTGLLIEAGDAEALANAIVRLKADPLLRERLAREGRKHAVEVFDERVAAKTAVEAYKESIGNE